MQSENGLRAGTAVNFCAMKAADTPAFPSVSCEHRMYIPPVNQDRKSANEIVLTNLKPQPVNLLRERPSLDAN